MCIILIKGRLVTQCVIYQDFLAIYLTQKSRIFTLMIDIIKCGIQFFHRHVTFNYRVGIPQ